MVLAERLHLGDPILGNLDVEIVVPVFNEERDLERSIRRLRRYLDDRLPLRVLVTIVDNASSDATSHIALASPTSWRSSGRCTSRRRAVVAPFARPGCRARRRSSPTWTWICPPTSTPCSPS